MEKSDWRRNLVGSTCGTSRVMGEQGSIWEASGKHLGGIWASGIWEASGRHLGGISGHLGSGRHLGSIWQASGRHLGSIWETSGKHPGIWDLGGIWEASLDIWDLVGIWEASGKHLGSIWEASGKHLGGIWEASGKHLGGIWGASGTPGGHGASGGPWKQLLQYLSAKMQKFL